ncbi:GDSL-type esterase/lipase family protein [Nonomuraea harbinensis]|uniref:GDSL-type esterase/lipase family protein n=1 Tax=Nonomuraea harbinensis TaxID=1286938 RepID=A0ABW1C7F4_9ACTN|nr:GDSL-type esterase/lipase family protein [Nonomuraea harbinensis]
MNAKTIKALVIGAAAVLLAADLTPAVHATAPAVSATVPASPPGPSVDPAERGRVLADDWRTSPDLAWTTDGDPTGLHVLVAEERTGYAWRTVATLSEPGFETDRWIGNVCFTASGRTAVAVYAPRAFTNDGRLFDRGAFTALIDVPTGRVTRLPARSTLAYFNPGCGSGELSVITQAKGGDLPGEEKTATRMSILDTRTATLERPVERPGQITSAIPVGDGIVASAGTHLIRVERDGATRRLARAASAPFRLAADGAGGVVYMEYRGDVANVRRLAKPVPGERPEHLASGPLTEVDVVAGTAGKVFLTGNARVPGRLPAAVTRLDVPAKAQVSTRGRLAILPGTRPSPGGAATPSRAWQEAMTLPDPRERRTLELTARIVSTGRQVEFAVSPGDASGGQSTAPASAGAAVAVSTNPMDTEAYCAVPRNDPRSQVYQPTPRQVEWAADQAVVGNLTMTRPADWKRSGLPAWSPQSLFPPRSLAGGGRVPVQVFLGIMSQESNLWQASGHALPGVTGNPLIGNFYGRQVYNDDASDDWVIRWADSDCGYGITQITDGMRKAGRERPCKDGYCEVALPATHQRAAALDYATNIAAGLRILQDKWNQTYRAGLIHSDGDPKWLENWFFAIWAYNSGFHPDEGDGSPWGVGWMNNPANPRYPANRGFFNQDPHDPAHPQHWPYPEKVIGFAAYSIATPTGPGFRPAWWVSEVDRELAKPPIHHFCVADRNHCSPGGSFLPNDPDVVGEPAGPCAHRNGAGQYDLKCWWHTPTEFHACGSGFCGNELHRFDTTYPEQPDGTSYPPNCSLSGLPSGAYVVDDVPTSVPSVRPGCSPAWGSHGSFTLAFEADGFNAYASKVDFHQLGSGFGGHFWFAHTRAEQGNHMFGVTGTWRPPSAAVGWTRVMVHLPSHGAHTQLAKYVIDLGGGAGKRHRMVSQRWGKDVWVDLGVFNLRSGASVSLSNLTPREEGAGWDWDIAFDAMAFIPTSKPTVDYVALGDSYSSGEGNAPYDPNSEYTLGSRKSRCHRSIHSAYPRQIHLPGGITPIASDPDAAFAFIACSGAKFAEVTGSSYPSKGEAPQLSQGYVDVDTDLVTLSVGGNDAGFSLIVTECLKGVSCIDGAIAQRIRGLADEYYAAYSAIRQKAPHATIVAVGYPHIFNPSLTIPLGCTELLAITISESRWINDMTDLLNEVAADAVARLRGEGADIRFANPVPAFRGHAVCDQDPYINTLSVVDGETFHPNMYGQQAYAGVVERALTG